MDKIIFAENSGNYYALDPAKIKEHITVTFDDYANRHWWEKGVYYNYDFIISVNSALGKRSAILVSYWDIKGKVLSCPDCAVTKLWYVKEFNANVPEQEYLNEIRAAMRDVEPVLPHKVFLQFAAELETRINLTPCNEEDIIQL